MWSLEYVGMTFILVCALCKAKIPLCVLFSTITMCHFSVHQTFSVLIIGLGGSKKGSVGISGFWAFC